MKHRTLTPTVCVLLAFLCMQARAENCFDPPTDPMSKNTADWKRLVKWTPPATNPEILDLQRLPAGRGNNINLDYYSFTFKKHPSRTIQDVFSRTRQRFEVYARGPARNSDQYFAAYRASAGLDAEQQKNAKLWASPKPLGALMTFVLASLQPPLTLTATGTGLVPVLEQGDVLVTCSNDLDFIFTTARTKKNDWHPVSGNRGFGMRDNGDGTWTFYSMAADRRAPYVMGQVAESRRWIWNKAHPFSSDLPDPEEELFRLGEEFWKSFFAAMKDDLETQGMSWVSETVNSTRYVYPLDGG